MNNDQVLVFQPRDTRRYTTSQNGLDDFLGSVVKLFHLELKGQFRIFPYVLSDVHEQGWGYTGFIYERIAFNDEDPLSYVNENQLLTFSRFVDDLIFQKPFSFAFLTRNKPSVNSIF